MKLQSLLKTICYKAGFSIKAIRRTPQSSAPGKLGDASTVDIRAALHHVDPYAGFDFSAFPRDLHGWGAESPTFRNLILELHPRLIIEVGTWKGASAVAMARLLGEAGLTASQIVCVDTWLGALEFWTDQSDPERFGSLQLRNGYPSVYYQFLANVCQEGLQSFITPFPQTSSTAALWFRYYGILADLIYLDASHEDDDVYEDVCRYWEVLRPGGILFGDDYAWDGVRLAVERFARENRQTLEFDADKWLMRKPR